MTADEAAAPSAQMMLEAMSHAGHHMPATPAEQAPTPETPHGDHMPCCPTPESGCLPGACVMPVAAVLLAVDVASPDVAVSATPTLRALRWVSYAPEPEPPPPRA